MALAILALAGWALDSVLVARELHQVPGADLAVHFTHLWWGPPALLALAFFLRHRARWRLPARPPAAPPSFNELAADLPPVVRTLAHQLTSDPAAASLIVFFHAQPTTAHTSADLAHHVGYSISQVELALSSMVRLGLITEQCACDLLFYRLNGDAESRQCLEQLFAWQEHWLAQAQALAQGVGAEWRQSPASPLPLIEPE